MISRERTSEIHTASKAAKPKESEGTVDSASTSVTGLAPNQAKHPDDSILSDFAQAEVASVVLDLSVQPERIGGLLDAAQEMGDKIPRLNMAAYQLEQQREKILSAIYRYYSGLPSTQMVGPEVIENCHKIWAIFRDGHYSPEKYDDGKLELLLDGCDYEKVCNFLVDLVDKGYVYELD